ncbi:MAG TPA: glycosyltransferase [Verrucomicrobiae bacterium]|nr:glycosyltransferase [Verrucomicrobiae bacterium]
MAAAASSQPRVSVGGKFFRLGEKKFYVQGLAYGPFAPDVRGSTFASPEQTAKDFQLIRDLQANTVRVYHVPPRWLLDLALENGLKLLVDIPWNKHLCFLDSHRHREEARHAVRQAVLECAKHPAVFAFSLVNEIPADIVRWSGTRAVADFIDELAGVAKEADPDCLCTFTNYPPTEFLQPQALDFACFNVYLHQPPAFGNYLARLQMIAEAKPLLLGELGIDSIREGEALKSQMLEWQLEAAFRSGLAGAVVFSFTDDWWRGGLQVENWAMGVTTRERVPKQSAAAVARAFQAAPRFPLARYPKVSVVVCSYNGDRTLTACLDSLQQLNYPDYEVILVDDGSRDTTAQIAYLRPDIRFYRHERNLGLSVARNTGISAAKGEIVAFTDADCRADPDWLYYLVSDLLRGEFAGMGGPNLLPPEDSPVATAVMASPGGPAHVMLTDRQAEHIPGCNMAFFKSALEEIGGFDPIFRAAGDDVDLCWRLQRGGYKIGFSPSAMVWHYRRSTVGEYLKQQHGYGQAEALLVRKHPECFNSIGGSIWRGRIYGASKFIVLPRPSIIYRGLFGSAGFQSLYVAEPAISLILCTTLEYHVLVTLPLWILSGVFHPFLPLAMTSLGVSLMVCVAAASQAALPGSKARPWSRPLIALLFLLQPVVRGWARYQGRLLPRPAPLAARQTLDSLALRDSGKTLDHAGYWSTGSMNRLQFVAAILRGLDQQGWLFKSDIGWSDYDVEIYGSHWSQLQLASVAEDHSQGRQLIRCRLRVLWSLEAKVVFWGLAGLELLAVGLLGTRWRWLWLLLLSLPILSWFLQRQGRNLQSTLIVFLDQIAKGAGLIKVENDTAAQPTAPVAVAPPVPPTPTPTPPAPAASTQPSP